VGSTIAIDERRQRQIGRGGQRLGVEADGFERACNLRVDQAVIGWVAYGQVCGSYGWIWGDQYISHGSFRFVVPSRSAAAFSELLAAVRAGTIADARTTTPASPALAPGCIAERPAA